MDNKRKQTQREPKHPQQFENLSEAELDKVAGGVLWGYTKQDDAGAAKGTVATKVNLAKGAGTS